MTPAEARKLWVEALRSGEFAQTTGVLRDENGYCCLGVACEIAVQHGVIEPPQGHKAVAGRIFYNFDGSDATLPDSVREWLGLWADDGSIYNDGSGSIYNDGESLTKMNDNGKTFAEIAAVIEDEPDGLVK
jgi:hypothetical protein